MSYRAVMDNGHTEQVATIRGWIDFGHWGRSIDPNRFDRIAHLAHHGYAMDPEELDTQLADALDGDAEPAPGISAADVARALRHALRHRGDSEILIVTGQ